MWETFIVKSLKGYCKVFLSECLNILNNVHLVQSQIKRLGIELIPSLSFLLKQLFLRFAYPEHLGSANRAHTLSCRLAILHRDGPGVFNFLFCFTFHTICLHRITLLNVEYLLRTEQPTGFFCPVGCSKGMK